MSFAASEEDSPPKISAAITKGKIRYFFYGSQSVSIEKLYLP